MEAVATLEREKMPTVNVRLRAVEQSDQPIMANFSTVSVAQGFAYLDYGFIEPALLAKVMVDSQNGKTLPEQVEGKFVARVSLGLDVMARLQHQMQQMLQSLSQQQANGKRAGQTQSPANR